MDSLQVGLENTCDLKQAPAVKSYWGFPHTFNDLDLGCFNKPVSISCGSGQQINSLHCRDCGEEKQDRGRSVQEIESKKQISSKKSVKAGEQKKSAPPPPPTPHSAESSLRALTQLEIHFIWWLAGNWNSQVMSWGSAVDRPDQSTAEGRRWSNTWRITHKTEAGFANKFPFRVHLSATSHPGRKCNNQNTTLKILKLFKKKKKHLRRSFT